MAEALQKQQRRIASLKTKLQADEQHIAVLKRDKELAQRQADASLAEARRRSASVGALRAKVQRLETRQLAGEQASGRGLALTRSRVSCRLSWSMVYSGCGDGGDMWR